MMQNWIIVFSVFITVYMLIYAIYTVIGSLFAYQKLRTHYVGQKYYNRIRDDFYLPVSIIVPAYNEERTILTTIENLLLSDYNLYEIVIVDDGSTDHTARILKETYNLTRNHAPIRLQVKSKPIIEVFTGTVDKHMITLVCKVSGGNKADAINAGINVSQYPYFVSMDADEVLQADALQNAARVFLEDEHVIGVGGPIRVSNDIEFKDGMPVATSWSTNGLVNIQRLEYSRAFLNQRVFNDIFNGNLNISGGFGLFKKDIVIKIGGYDPKSVGEDMNLVMRIHEYHIKNNLPYAIRYAPDAICWTQVPFTFRDVGKQRSRWHRGLIQVMWQHRSFLLNAKFRFVSLFSFMYFLLYEALAPIIELLGILIIIYSILTKTLNWPFLITFTAIYTVFYILQTQTFYFSNFYISNFNRNRWDYLRVLITSLKELIIFRPYLFLVRLYAMITYKTRLHNWTKITRE